MTSDINQQAFFALVQGGLWETEVRLANLGKLNYSKIFSLAKEQAVVGLVAAGIDHVVDVKIPQEVALSFVGSALQLEQRNLAMNDFIAGLIEKLRDQDVYLKTQNDSIRSTRLMGGLLSYMVLCMQI